MRHRAKNLRAYIARKYLGDKSNRPVVEVPGNTSPAWEGEAAHYRTAGGTRIQYPGAYSKRGWSNMFYQNSDRRIEVGAAWLDRAEAAWHVCPAKSLAQWCREQSVPPRDTGARWTEYVVTRDTGREVVTGWAFPDGSYLSADGDVA